MLMRVILTALVAVLFAAPSAKADKPGKRTALDDRVDRALAYLNRTQEEDGSWRGGGQNNAAITGLAVMAFLSAGHVPGEGRYGETIEKGVDAVLKMQQSGGLVGTNAGHVMYHHGICTRVEWRPDRDVERVGDRSS